MKAGVGFGLALLACGCAPGSPASCDKREQFCAPGFRCVLALNWCVADSDPPTVIEMLPQDGAKAVPQNATLSARFSETLDITTATAASFVLSVDGRAVAGEVRGRGDEATFHPWGLLVADRLHTATLTTDLRDEAGNRLVAEVSWSFTTGSGPSLIETDTAVRPGIGSTAGTTPGADGRGSPVTSEDNPASGRWSETPDSIGAASAKRVLGCGVGLDAAGAALVSWAQMEGNGRATLWAQRAPLGGRWQDGSPQRVDSHDGGLVELGRGSLAVAPDGRAVLAWRWVRESTVSSHARILGHAPVLGSTNGWLPEVELLTTGDGVGAAGGPTVDVGGDRWLVAWGQTAESDGHVSYDGGDTLMVRGYGGPERAASWESARELYPAALPGPSVRWIAGGPIAALNRHGEHVVAWMGELSDTDGFGLPPRAVLANVDGVSPVELDGPDTSSVDDVARSDTGDAAVVWMSTRADFSAEPRAAFYEAKSRQWSALERPAALSDPGELSDGDAFEARVTYAGGGEALLAWTTLWGEDATSTMYIAAATRTALGWKRAVVLGEGYLLFAPILLADRAGNSLLVWTEQTEGGLVDRIWAAWHRPGAGWGAPRLLFQSDAAQRLLDPFETVAAGISERGSAVVVWATVGEGEGGLPDYDSARLMTLRFE